MHSLLQHITMIEPTLSDLRGSIIDHPHIEHFGLISNVTIFMSVLLID